MRIFFSNSLKRIICFILFAISLSLFSGCSVSEWIENELQDDPTLEDNNEENSTDYSVVFTLARYLGERLDPFLSKSRTNRDLLSLCYDPLIHVDSSSVAVGVIAESFEIYDNKVIFTLNPNARFFDGTPVSAADCEYSYSVALDAKSVYYDRFDYITDYEAVSSDKFAVYFDTNSIYNINLCDIPIIKRGTNGDFIPVGSGKYQIVRDNASVYLEKNPYSFVDTGENFDISKIMVHDIQSDEELFYNFNYNKVHGSYTDITDDGSEFRGNIETISFCDNSLVFAVVNKNFSHEFLSSPSFSKGLTYCIDREYICEKILSGGTQPVWYPFNPDWKVTVNADLNRDIYSTVSAHEYFNDCGLLLSGLDRVYNDEIAELRIVVNSESLTKIEVAESIAKDLENMGFSVTVKSLTWDKFIVAVTERSYDIYIGEVLLPQNMDISVLYSYGVNTGHGYVEEYIKDAVESFNVGDLSMRDLLSVFQEELPVIPLYFNRGALAVNRVVSGDFSPSVGNIYNGIEDWKFS